MNTVTIGKYVINLDNVAAVYPTKYVGKPAIGIDFCAGIPEEGLAGVCLWGDHYDAAKRFYDWYARRARGFNREAPEESEGSEDDVITQVQIGTKNCSQVIR
jgi:hypothetical protein